LLQNSALKRELTFIDCVIGVISNSTDDLMMIFAPVFITCEVRQKGDDLILYLSEISHLDADFYPAEYRNNNES
jgi:hypothetical protein